MRTEPGGRIFLAVFLVEVLLNQGVEGACKSGPISELEQLVLNKHNELRALHEDTPPLCYADLTGEDVSFAAQDWADHVADIGESSHTPNPKAFGENIAWSSFHETPEPEPLYIDAVQRWYNEINNWDFALGQRNGKGITSHFTQVVWKTTTQLNCGFASSDTFKRAYVVCQYWPKGNWVKAADYPNEVHPLKGSVNEDDLLVDPVNGSGSNENEGKDSETETETDSTSANTTNEGQGSQEGSADDSETVDDSETSGDSASVDDSETSDDSATIDDSETSDDSATVDDSETSDDSTTVDDSETSDDSATVDDSETSDDSATVNDSETSDDSATVDDSETSGDSGIVDDSETSDDSATFDDSETSDDSSTVDDSETSDDSGIVEDSLLGEGSSSEEDGNASENYTVENNEGSEENSSPELGIENSLKEVPQLEELVFSTQEYATCNCWTRQCGFCSKLECTVKQDLANSQVGIAVSSVVRRVKYNSIVFYDEEGEEIGKFQWNKRGIHLTGCIACITPKALKGKCIKNVQTLWVVSIADGILQIKIGGEVMYENKLKGQCKERYSKARRFAFYDMPGENYFSFVSAEMEAGETIVSTGCA